MVVGNIGSEVNIKGLCNEVSVINCSNGATAVFITVSDKEGSISAKKWDCTPDEVEKMNGLKGKVLQIRGTVTQYKGVSEIKVSSVSEATNESLMDYVKSLDIDKLFADFSSFLKTHISEGYYNVVKLLLNTVPDKFVYGYASTSHHDNIRGGLVNHTLKMLQIAEALLHGQPALDFMKDRIYTGIVLHDIGKVWCYNETGGIATLNYVDHKALGIEMLATYKQQILQFISEDEYYQLVAIILGHHGEYGEPCHSVATSIINGIDILDSNVTELVQEMEKVNFQGDIKSRGSYLHI